MRKTNWPDLPNLAGVVALLYQADWTRLSLAGKVSGSDEPVLRTYRPGMSGNTARPSVTLHVAPGRRFRRDDGELVVGCDGERVWQWLADPPPDGKVGWDSTRIPPFAALLCPSWLLTAYDLEVLGPWIACGRDGIRVAGTARQSRNRRLGLFAVLGGEGTPGASRVEVVIDRELGILLCCKQSFGAGDRDKGRRPDVREFRHLEVGAVIDEAMFAPPAGSRVSRAKGTGRLLVTNFFGIPEAGPFGLPLGPVETAAGLAAGGLGAAIRYTPVSWLSRADDGTGEPMPDDDPPPGASADGALVSDDVLYLLYRSGGRIPRFTGTSHVWMDGRAILAGVPESVRKTGLGGVGHLIDALTRNSRNLHTVSKVRMDGWQRYRIEPAWSPGSPAGKRPDPSVTGCDGKRYWEAHEDRVGVGKSRPAPTDLADLTDTSWLLGCELSGGEPITFDSRAAFRLSVRGGPAQSQFLWPGFPAVAVVDAETGHLIRLTCYVDGKPACRYELRDVTPAPEGASGDTGYAVPPGLPVIDVDSGP